MQRKRILQLEDILFVAVDRGQKSEDRKTGQWFQESRCVAVRKSLPVGAAPGRELKQVEGRLKTETKCDG